MISLRPTIFPSRKSYRKKYSTICKERRQGAVLFRRFRCKISFQIGEQNCALPSYFSQSFFAKSSSQSRSLEEHGGTRRRRSMHATTTTTTIWGNYLLNQFISKEVWVVAFGLDALKKLLFLFRHITTEAAFEMPPPRKKEKEKKLLEPFWQRPETDMKTQFTWAARSLSSFLPFSSTPLVAPKGIFYHFFLKLRAYGPFSI